MAFKPGLPIAEDNRLPVAAGDPITPADPVIAALTANGAGAQFAAGAGDFNITIDGTFVADVAVRKSFDAASTWHTAISNALRLKLPPSFTWSDPETTILYDVLVSNYVSGTINVRFSK